MSRESLGISATSHNIRDDKYTNAVTVVSYSDSDRARFWAKVTKTRTCWLWTSTKLPSGYGQMSIGPRGSSPHYAHRIAWALSHGPIPDGQHVLHSCDVPSCVNSAHLFLGTHRLNMEDAARKERLRVPRPSARKLTEAKREDVRRRYAAGGVTLQQLADEHRVTRPYIWQIVHKRSVEFRKKGAA